MAFLIFCLSIWYITTVLCWVLGSFVKARDYFGGPVGMFLCDIPIINLIILSLICLDLHDSNQGN